MNADASNKAPDRAAIALPALLIALVSVALLILTASARTTEKTPPIASLRVDLDSATQAQLRLLPGVGPALARRVVSSRNAEGPFRSLGDLRRVRGVGDRTIKKLAPYARVVLREESLPK